MLLISFFEENNGDEVVNKLDVFVSSFFGINYAEATVILTYHGILNDETDNSEDYLVRFNVKEVPFRESNFDFISVELEQTKTIDDKWDDYESDELTITPSLPLPEWIDFNEAGRVFTL